MRISLVAFFVFFTTLLQAQDSIRSMQNIEVKGFETRTSQLNVPASISTITNRDMQRFGNVSLVPVFNTVPGVRMEERSPGSYRLSIRGSLLRSPFGVRNVKVYWKDMPLTDAGGNTYLNLVDFNGVGSAEILKGPAGSVYGAGTGGVVTLGEPSWTAGKKHKFLAQVNTGSFGTFGAMGRWQGGTEKLNWQVLQSHYQADGYRQNSRMRRDLTQANLNWQTGNRNKLEALLMYGDLAYRTPGGLTLAQMNADPTQARPATPVAPGAVQQQAGVYNKTLFAGLTNTYTFNENWKNSTSVAGMFTDFENPFITNYEKRKEDGIALRTKFQYSKQAGKTRINWLIGGEIQGLYSTIDSTGNKGGVPDNNLVSDRVVATQQFLFTQAELELHSRLILQAGLSFNGYGYSIERTIPAKQPVDLSFDPQLLPRLAILYKLTGSISIHASASKGYSAPGLAEIRPSAGGIYSDLQAEYGWNYELGVKGSAWRSRMNFDVALFSFNLRDAIVRRVNAQGAEYFVNAGGTEQNGVEWFIEGYLINSVNGFLKQLRLWNSSSFFNFRFTDYKVNTSDYSGNELTGVPSKVIVSGLDAAFIGGFYLNATFNYTSRLPLTDANDVYADDYRLWQGRAGWKHKWKPELATEVFVGIDNAGNELYSLGNDINAFGKRFYNPAPERNYFAGLRVTF